MDPNRAAVLIATLAFLARGDAGGAAGGDSCDPGVRAGRPLLDAHDRAICCDSTP